jgi:hypothetical protein
MSKFFFDLDNLEEIPVTIIINGKTLELNAREFNSILDLDKDDIDELSELIERVYDFLKNVFDEIGRVKLSNGETVSLDYAEYHYKYSDKSEQWFDGDHIELENGETWSAEEFEEDGFVCEISGKRYSKEEEHSDYAGISRFCSAEEIKEWLGEDIEEGKYIEGDKSRIEEENQCVLSLTSR